MSLVYFLLSIDIKTFLIVFKYGSPFLTSPALAANEIRVHTFLPNISAVNLVFIAGLSAVTASSLHNTSIVIPIYDLIAIKVI